LRATSCFQTESFGFPTGADCGADLAIDTKGKDSWRFTEAGAQTVLTVSPNEVVVIRKGQTDYSEAGILKLLTASDVDVLFMEGFYDALSKNRRVAKLVVGRDCGEVSTLLEGCEIEVPSD